MRLPLIALTLEIAACGGGGAATRDAAPDNTRDAVGSVDAPRAADAPSGPVDGTTPSDAAMVGDAGTTTDAGPVTDAGGSACTTIPASLGVVMPRSPSAAREPGPPLDLKYVDPLNGDAEPDVFKLVLIDGRGAFASGGIVPKTVQLGGVESAYATCGACVEIFSNVNAQGNFAGFYLAKSGTLTITSVSPRLTGTLSDVTFAHLDDNDAVVDSCAPHLDSLAFDVPVP